MLTRQQRALRRRVPAPIPAQSKLRRAAIWAQDKSEYALALLKRLLAPLAGLPWWADVLSVFVAILSFYELLFSTIPRIQPDAAISPSWHDLPLSAKIDSHFFGAKSVEAFCIVENVTWNTDKSKTRGLTNMRIVGDAEKRVEGAANYIPSGGTITFACNIFDSITGRYLPSSEIIPISLIKLHIRLVYKTYVWPWARSLVSPTFTWRAVSGGYQWLEGDTSDKS